MGLLDDAIREHLDLKRRRGADPDEIQRAEREALGPVRRAPEQREPSDTTSDDALAYDHETDAAYDRESGWEEPLAGELDEYDEPEATDETRVARRPHRADEEEAERPKEEEAERPEKEEAEPPEEDELFADEEPFEDEPAAGEVPAAPPPQAAPRSSPPSRPSEEASEETVEYDVEDALERDAGGEEDVLEETPEFLQDTPDHDRLWFEQRPPRDFDFNE